MNLTKKQKSSSNITPLTNKWEKAVPFQKIPKGLASLKSQDCGACHQNHYQEWLTSTHAHAWTDVQFQSEIKKESSPYMCINCHIPLENQQEFVIKGLVNGDIYQPVKEKNTHFDKSLQQEGINCASCHVRNGAVIGITDAPKAPHKTIADPSFLSETLCIGCHNANHQVNKQLVCTFETGDEWKAGPYFGKKNCISCHMKTTNRSLVDGYNVRKSHFHNFPGSGLPKVKGDKVAMLIGYSFHPSVLKKVYQKGDKIHFDFKVKNEFAGHKVPTGDPERFFTIDFKIRNQKNKVVFEKSNRIGEKWKWYPEAKKLSDTNILPNHELTFNFDYNIQKEGDYQLEVIVSKHRMTPEAIHYNKMSNDYPISREIYQKVIKFTVN